MRLAVLIPVDVQNPKFPGVSPTVGKKAGSIKLENDGLKILASSFIFGNRQDEPFNVDELQFVSPRSLTGPLTLVVWPYKVPHIPVSSSQFLYTRSP